MKQANGLQARFQGRCLALRSQGNIYGSEEAARNVRHEGKALKKGCILLLPNRDIRPKWMNDGSIVTGGEKGHQSSCIGGGGVSDVTKTFVAEAVIINIRLGDRVNSVLVLNWKWWWEAETMPSGHRPDVARRWGICHGAQQQEV